MGSEGQVQVGGGFDPSETGTLGGRRALVNGLSLDR